MRDSRGMLARNIALQGPPDRLRAAVLRGIPARSERLRSFASEATNKRLICRDFMGATGLEPATSGVTGRRSHETAFAP